MNKKDQKRHMAYEALVLLGMLALLTFICRLWPILLLIILGIFAAVIRLLFLSSRKIEVIVPLPLLPEPGKKHREKMYRCLHIQSSSDGLQSWCYLSIRKQDGSGRHRMPKGSSRKTRRYSSLLNRAGGYRRRVVIRGLQRVGTIRRLRRMRFWSRRIMPRNLKKNQRYKITSCWPLSGQMLIFELNARCNEAIGENLSELILLAEELPSRESWADICQELIRANLDVQCVSEGIKINLTQSNAERK